MINSKSDSALEKIFDQAKDDNFRTEISIADVIYAQEIINRNIYSESEILYVVSAINLLNSAIKRREFKKIISYSQIKGHVTRLLTYLISVDRRKFDIDLFINPEEKCAYIGVSGLQFSFHYITISEPIQHFITSDRNWIKPDR